MIKKIYFFIIILQLIVLQVNAQVGIGTTNPDNSSTLDVVSTNSGVLIPRIILSSTNVAAPVVTPATSLLIYNTATAGAGLTAVSPGYYYWDGAQWVRLQSGVSSNDWSLIGNSGTNASTNFLGTTDNVDLIFRRNNTRAGRIGLNSTSFGTNALNPASTGPQNTAIGVNALAAHTTSFNNTAIGYNSLSATTNLGANTAVGANTLTVASASFNTVVGAFGLQNSTSGGSNVAMGYDVMRSNSTGSGNVAIGFTALRTNSTGFSNVAIGSGSLYNNSTGNGNIAIGYDAGANETGNDKLYIDNSNTTNPLIYGDFASNVLRTNGTLQVNIPGSGGYAFPNADGTNGQVLTSNGAGALTWQTPGAAAASWLLGGNATTNPTTQFLGTTDAQDLVLRTNNLERARISSNGFMAVNAPINAFGRFYSFTNTSGIDAVVGEASSFGSAGVIGYGNHAGGYGAFGYNTASGVGVLGSSVFGSASTRIGVVGISEGSLFGSLTGFNLGLSSTGMVGMFGLSTGPAATTRYGGFFTYDTDNNLSGSVDANGPIAQLAGYDATRSIYYGGYFAGGQDYTGTFNGGNTGTNANAVDYVYVGTRVGTTNYKIIGNGSVSTIIDGENDKKHIMFAPEAPEILFQDYGVGKLVNGEVRIEIDPILAKNIFVDESHPLKVFVQLKGDCKGVYVTDESNTGFTVKELQGGTSNVSFSYQIVANRSDRKDATGKLLSKHVDVRLPDAPPALESAKIEKLEVKKRNKS